MLVKMSTRVALLFLAALQVASAMTIAGKPNMMIKPYKREPLQDIVTWDEHSLFVRGERILFFSGEFHPFRLPVPGLWLDVFQKVKALGYNGVSFYVDWALLEGKQGHFSAEGIFALEPFFDAAQTAGIYLLARPGPYIQAEVSGGGFPGWMQRNPGLLRTRDPEYLHATDLYVASISKIIAKAQITNGGPVILLQPENEYSQGVVPEFPDPVYFSYVEKQYRDGGIIVPFMSNDARPQGDEAPGPPSQPAAVDIYGFDGYPLGFDCANPTEWPSGYLPTDYYALHLNQSSSTPVSIPEFQGGSFDPWGGTGFENCAALLNHEFERVFYKNNYAAGVTIFNLYMTYGGTNWGNLGFPGDYTSYDYGAVITEDRLVTREKYSEAKLQANFLQASPAYLTAVPQSNANANGSYTGNGALTTTALLGNKTNFFIVRHAMYNSLDTTNYTITLPTSQGNITIPQTGGSLSLHGRDSKFHVTDYDVGGINVLYSTAEIFTWKQYGSRRVLIVYSGPGELHELAITRAGNARLVEGSDVAFATVNDETIITFETSSTRRIVVLECGLFVYILDRNEVYDYWVVDLPDDATSGNYTNANTLNAALILKAGYLLRTVKVADESIALTGDLNATTALEIIGGPPNTRSVSFNGKDLQFKQDHFTNSVMATLEFESPQFSIPDLASCGWKTIDTLPEIQSGYDDSAWVSANNPTTNNTRLSLLTPTSLFASDYGFNAGYLLYRGHFTAKGGNSSVYLSTAGGYGFGHSIWLNGVFVDSFSNNGNYQQWNQSYQLPGMLAGKTYVLTVLIDNTGLDYNDQAGSSRMKFPRGILDYSISGMAKSDVAWKVTGNLGGEDYQDHTRGPLNEGGLFAERQGYHLPGAPTSSWSDSEGPKDGISTAGVQFYSTTFDLNMPLDYDIPLAFSFGNSSMSSYRVQIYVNGYQFGKYIHNIGPQSKFPVPQGIWNYQGSNYVAFSLWALEAAGAKVDDLQLVAGPVISSGYGAVQPSPQTGWTKRANVY
ncbi:glycoside hydrolase family 35 protein [Acrodontium crateriforme]|uniref:Beta-galactosidase n=1 Tax=Acrodontium crateriforme TaxID=150365 RepID=A0AAQ3RC55_9PEZI|nr:glycoside hydrolase family 35 protein [Acrodontium crateriforme]